MICFLLFDAIQKCYNESLSFLNLYEHTRNLNYKKILCVTTKLFKLIELRGIK